MRVRIRKYMLIDLKDNTEHGPFVSALEVRDAIAEFDNRVAGVADNLARALIAGSEQDVFIWEMFLNVKVETFFDDVEI